MRGCAVWPKPERHVETRFTHRSVSPIKIPAQRDFFRLIAARSIRCAHVADLNGIDFSDWGQRLILGWRGYSPHHISVILRGVIQEVRRHFSLVIRFIL